MKKIIHITIVFIILIITLFNPVQNFYYEQKRIGQEKFIRNFMEENSYKVSEVKKLPKKARPDLKYYHDFLMMRDPNTNTIPHEKILDAFNQKESRLNSLSYLNRKTEINWTERGPNEQGGRTRAIMLDGNYSSNQRVWAAGVSGGLWYTTNITSPNASWTKISDTWDNLEIVSIASDPNDANIIYAGTGEKRGSAGVGLGIWKTTDGGASWAQLSSTNGFRFVNTLKVRDESGQSAVYAGVGGSYHEGQWHGHLNTGLWKSTDGGSSWSEQLGPNTSGTNYEPSEIEIDANNRIWIATRTNAYGESGGDLFYSDDGQNFTPVSTGEIGSFDRVFIEVFPGDTNILYAMMENSNSGLISWMGKSIDGGANWTNINIPVDDDGNPLGDYQGSMDYWGSLVIDPNDSNTIYTGGFTLFKSTDSGTTWTRISEWYPGTSLPYVHADQHNILALDSNNILFTNDGGIFLTTDGGNTFSHRNTAFNTTQFYSTAIHPSSDYILGGTQDNGTWKLPNAGIQVGTEVTGGDGAFVHIDQDDPNYQFSSYVYNRVYRSTNGGSSFSLYYDISASDGTDAGFFVNPSVIDSETQDFYAAFDENSILRQKDYTILSSHDFINISLGSTASAFRTSPHTTGLLFVGTASGRVFKITDAHTDNYSIEEIGPSSTTSYISSIDIGNNDDQILITLSNYGIDSVFETISGGSSNSWYKVEGDLPDMPIRWGFYNRDNFNQVVVATEIGVWITDDISVSTPAWYPSNDGLANVRVDMLAMRADGSMSAGTHGRGMFSSTGFTSTAPLNAAFSSNKTSGTVPVEVTFKDRSTGNPTSWVWDFGDGNSSTDQNPTHIYNSAGTFSISLNVGDGNATDVVTKNNSIFVTSVQDTLWSDGFESCFESYPRNGRGNYGWTWRDENGDDDGPGCYPESINAGFELAYDEDKGMGFGNAATDGTTWDDWLISPEIWLRPGVDNLVKFYANGFNSTYPESFDVMLSPSGNNAVSDFTVTLAEVIDSGAEWNEYTYDLTPWAGSKVRVAIHHKSQAQYYEFYDLFMVTAGQLSPDGSPNAPSGITIEPKKIYEDTDGDGTVSSGDTWTNSDTATTIYWNRNGEPDFASYNVYSSQTDGFTADSSTLLGQGVLGTINVNIPVLDANDSTDQTVLNPDYYNYRSFGADYIHHENLSQGETWYYKVGAVDNDGNETISNQLSYTLDSVGPTAGTVSITDIVDNGYLRSTSDVSITANGWSDNTGINYYVMGIGSSNSDNSADIVSYQNVGTTNLELTGLTLDDYTTYYLKVFATDVTGNQSDLITTGFTTYTQMLGDYDLDWDVDVEDLNAFVNAWPNAGVETTVDIGPATGSSPYLIPSFDNLNDINDLSVFSRNWLWTKSQAKSSSDDLNIKHIDFEAEMIGNQIIIELPENITAGRFEFGNEGNQYIFNAQNKQGYLVLENDSEEEEYYELEFGILSSNDKKLIINIDGAKISNNIQFNYQLFSKDGLAGSGMMELRNPDEFKLYQNYPNPFTNQTTIMYDIPSLMVNIVDVEINIYNTLGKLVRTIDEGDKGAGQHTTIWDGKNDDGENVSSGVYFYQLRSKVDGQSDYNKTKKMVIVR